VEGAKLSLQLPKPQRQEIWMKIIICGAIDASWSEMLNVEGHQLDSYFPSSLDAIGLKARTLLERHKCPIYSHRFSMSDLESALERQVDAMITIGYPYIVPVDKRLRGINVHPSYLPSGRGISPIPEILLKHPESAGVTIHKLEQALDSGDILLQERFTLSAFDDQITLLTRMYLRSAELVKSVLSDLEYYWSNSTPQPSIAPWESRSSFGTIDPELGVASNIRIWQAFGAATCIETQGEKKWLTGLSGWLEPHSYPAGRLIVEQHPFLTVAVTDGFLVAVT
jgi:methionyl-tRNA formyltransferase